MARAGGLSILGRKAAMCAQSLAARKAVGAFLSIVGSKPCGSSMSERLRQHADNSAFAEAALRPSIPRSFAATELPWIAEEEGHTIDAVLATLSMESGCSSSVGASLA